MFFFIINLRRLRICCKNSKLKLNAKCINAKQKLCWLNVDVELWMLKNEKSWKSIFSISFSIDVISISLFSKSNELLKKNFKIAKCDAMNFWFEERFKKTNCVELMSIKKNKKLKNIQHDNKNSQAKWQFWSIQQDFYEKSFQFCQRIWICEKNHVDWTW